MAREDIVQSQNSTYIGEPLSGPEPALPVRLQLADDGIITQVNKIVPIQSAHFTPAAPVLGAITHRLMCLFTCPISQQRRAF